MDKLRRAMAGRRLFTAECKREQLAPAERQEVTLAELARDLSIAPSVVPRWHRLSAAGSAAAIGANEDVVPASELRLALARIKELERALGKKAMEIESLQAARDEVKKRPRYGGGATR